MAKNKKIKKLPNVDINGRVKDALEQVITYVFTVADKLDEVIDVVNNIDLESKPYWVQQHDKAVRDMEELEQRRESLYQSYKGNAGEEPKAPIQLQEQVKKIILDCLPTIRYTTDIETFKSNLIEVIKEDENK